MKIITEMAAVLDVLRERGVTSGKIGTSGLGDWTLEFVMEPAPSAPAAEEVAAEPLEDLTQDPATRIMTANVKRQAEHA